MSDLSWSDKQKIADDVAWKIKNQMDSDKQLEEWRNTPKAVRRAITEGNNIACFVLYSIALIIGIPSFVFIYKPIANAHVMNGLFYTWAPLTIIACIVSFIYVREEGLFYGLCSIPVAICTGMSLLFRLISPVMMAKDANLMQLIAFIVSCGIVFLRMCWWFIQLIEARNDSVKKQQQLKKQALVKKQTTKGKTKKTRVKP